jgi:hypothetical protein
MDMGDSEHHTLFGHSRGQFAGQRVLDCLDHLGIGVGGVRGSLLDQLSVRRVPGSFGRDKLAGRCPKRCRCQLAWTR